MMLSVYARYTFLGLASARPSAGTTRASRSTATQRGRVHVPGCFGGINSWWPAQSVGSCATDQAESAKGYEEQDNSKNRIKFHSTSLQGRSLIRTSCPESACLKFEYRKRRPNAWYTPTNSAWFSSAIQLQ